jgi:predicted ATP-dependent serine protease
MEKPKFLITYKCNSCGQESNFAETQEARCHYCNNSTGLTEVNRQPITAELMEAQLKASVQRMFSNLQSAFESMTDEDKAAFGDKDAEKEMLLLLAKAKQFKENIDQLNLKEPEEDKKDEQAD